MIAEHLLICAVLALRLGDIAAVKDLPGGVCSIDNQACVLQDNLVHQHVSSMDQCRMLCQDESTCAYVTYFGTNSFPFSETCMIFSSCNEMYECTDCRTEDQTCLPCSSMVQSHLGDNLLDFILNIEEEIQCKAECIAEDSCNFYTYHNSSDPSYPGTCFLMSSLQDPTLPCVNCRTGAVNCQTTEGRCFFLQDDGNSTKSGQLITSSIKSSVHTMALGKCSLTVVAVGGGGAGFSGWSGGGSGYVSWEEVTISRSVTFEVSVGSEGVQSEVRDDSGELLLEAKAGEDGRESNYHFYGGDGYSGGGGGGRIGGAGGTDGGDGERGTGGDYSGGGGKGSGVNLTSIPVQGFLLSNGLGGIAGTPNGEGGGGGGVLVDGEELEVGTEGDGQGYGGGGGGENNNNKNGKSGVIIITLN